MRFSYLVILAIVLIVIALYLFGVLRFSLKGVWIITHHRRGDLGIETFTRMIIVPYWFFVLLLIAVALFVAFYFTSDLKYSHINFYYLKFMCKQFNLSLMLSSMW